MAEPTTAVGRLERAAPRRVVLIVAAGAEVLDLMGPFQVFTTANDFSRKLHPASAAAYRIEIVTLGRRRGFTTNSGLAIKAHATFREVRGEIDTLLIAGGSAIEEDTTSQESIRWLTKVATRTRRVGSVCTGAFLLARAGLLNGRKATTHWNWSERLAGRYPEVQIDSNPIFIRDENIYTSAGVTAGMDLALALVDQDLGSRLALDVARHLVLYLRRPGSQSQFSAALSLQASDSDPLRQLQSWVLENLRKPMNVRTLAERVAMSPRNFARVFSKEMRITPAKFIERMRAEAARRRLEETRHSLKRIAEECGFGNPSTMRDVFQRAVGISPARYRQHFRGR